MARSTLVAIFVSLVVIFVYHFFHIGINTEHQYYLRYATSSQAIIESRLSSSFIYLLLNEPLWLVVNVILMFALKNPVIIISVLFYFSISVKVFYVVKSSFKYWPVYCLLFFDPNFYLHLRQQFGLAVFLIFILLGRNRIGAIVSSFIHVIMFSTYLPMLGTLLLKRWYLIAVFILGFILLGAEMPRQASSIGDERIVKSGLGWFLYTSLFLLLISEKARTLNGHLAKYFLGLYILLYFFIDLPQRFLIISFPFVLIYTCKMRDSLLQALAFILLYIPLLKGLIL